MGGLAALWALPAIAQGLTPTLLGVANVTAGAGLTGGGATQNITIARSTTVNSQTGISYAVASGDNAKLITFSNAAAVAATLPSPASVPVGWEAWLSNKGTGVVTVTPTAGNIGGLANITIGYGGGTSVVNDGSNYQLAQIPGGQFITITGDCSGSGSASIAVTCAGFGGTFGFLPNVATASYVPLVGANLVITGSGHNDIYTVPAGKKALIGANIFRVYNPSAGNISWFAEIKVSGTYYPISITSTLTTGTGASGGLGTAAIVLNAGESLSINCATTAGLNIRGDAAEFNVSETRLATARILGLVSGDQTLLTTPVGKTILPITTSAAGVAIVAAVIVTNNSGGALNYYLNQVPSGGTVGATNQLYPVTSIADKSTSGFTVGTMTAGDFISINSSSSNAGQMAWITYYQIP